VLRRFHTEPGKAFAFCIFLPLERCSGEYNPFPRRGYDRRCAFPEVPLAFDLQNASHHQYALACGYLQSTTIPEHACPVHVFMDTALGCSLGLCILAWIKHNAYIRHTLPAGDTPLFPARDTIWLLCLHCCNRLYTIA